MCKKYMTKKYQDYLYSKKWTNVKKKLNNIYIKQGWNINCYCCGKTNNLQVHHFSYKNIFNEKLNDERIWELGFMCKNCHYKWHKKLNFKEDFEEKSMKDFLKSL